jgi:hypothetical protein
MSGRPWSAVDRNGGVVMNILMLTPKQVIDLAVVAFKDRDLRSPADADAFFIEYSIGNTVDYPDNPYERFEYYRTLLSRLQATDPQKFAAVHKGTPLYFLSWLAFDLHQFEAALHFIDAAIAEDKRVGPDWFNNPGPQLLMLNAPVQTARRTIEALAFRIDKELNRFEKHYRVKFSLDTFLKQFAEPQLKHGTPAIVAAFYAFVLEFDDRAVEMRLRSAPMLGSYQPLFLHLFKGGLLLETVLRDALPQVDRQTLAGFLSSGDFKNRMGFNPALKEVNITTLCSDAALTTPESAFVTTWRLRNMMGHSLIRQPLPRLPDDYITLAHQEINAFLYSVFKLYAF